MTNIERKNAIILLSVVAIAAILSSYAITAYATEPDENARVPGLCGWKRGWGNGGGGRFRGRFGVVEVSEEYKQNVLDIVNADGDVKNLLAEGYSITVDAEGNAIVRPIMKTYVDAEGNVETTATNAIVMLENDTTGRAVVRVDLATDSVTEIVIVSRTVIDKT